MTSAVPGPDPANPYPLPGTRRLGFLKPLVDHPRIEIGDYTYYDDPAGPEHFADKCVLYHFPFVGDRLIIGRFCALASDIKFIMNGANHAMDGVSTFPFNIFGHGWEEGFDVQRWADGSRGDTRVGHDVWIGREAMIMPGVTIGNGAVVAARSVVASDVPDYAIVGGNPAKVIRMRYSDAEIARLLAIAWWDWPIAVIGANVNLIAGGDLDALEAIADKNA